MRNRVLQVAGLVVACSATPTPVKEEPAPVPDPSANGGGDEDSKLIDSYLSRGEATARELCACLDNACKNGVMARSFDESPASELGEARAEELRLEMTDAQHQRMAAVKKRVDECAPADVAVGPCKADEDAAKFLAANKSCKTDGDCMAAQSLCYMKAEDCCVVYVNRKHDAAKWKTITDALGKCNSDHGGSGVCGCCAGIPHEPKCNAGKCG